MSAIRTILLAEDSPADAEMAIDALRDANLANPIVHVEDGVEALDYLLQRGAHAGREDGLPAVLLLDIKMPRMDGLEVLKHIRSHDKLKKLPVVIWQAQPAGQFITAPRSGFSGAGNSSGWASAFSTVSISTRLTLCEPSICT